jgi:hypothetical protein
MNAGQTLNGANATAFGEGAYHVSLLVGRKNVHGANPWVAGLAVSWTLESPRRSCYMHGMVMLRGQIPGFLIRGRGAGTPRPRLFGLMGDPDSNRDCIGVNRAVLPLDHPPPWPNRMVRCFLLSPWNIEPIQLVFLSYTSDIAPSRKILAEIIFI